MNYNNYSNKSKNRNKQNFEASPKAEEVTNETVVEQEETRCPLRRGVVTDCVALNVRVAPGREADVLRVINCGTNVDIDPERSTDEWYYVSFTADDLTDGYCMKKYIKLEE